MPMSQALQSAETSRTLSNDPFEGGMQGMQHGSMGGMQHGSMQDMKGMKHDSMEHREHGSMKGMEGNGAPIEDSL